MFSVFSFHGSRLLLWTVPLTWKKWTHFSGNLINTREDWTIAFLALSSSTCYFLSFEWFSSFLAFSSDSLRWVFLFILFQLYFVCSPTIWWKSCCMYAYLSNAAIEIAVFYLTVAFVVYFLRAAVIGKSFGFRIIVFLSGLFCLWIWPVKIISSLEF